jgi:N-acetylglucosaminyldiphosphoundecaprenol N-acetyl-beta-D-mannosaminyltransferase
MSNYIINSVKILNVDLKLFNTKSLFEVIEKSIKNKSIQNIIASDFRHIDYFSKGRHIHSDTLVYPDSTGTYLALKFFYFFRTFGFKRIVSTDFHLQLLHFASEKGFKLFLLGDTHENILNFQNEVKKKYPKLNVVGVSDGYKGIMRTEIFDEINNSNVDIILIGLGVPKQEKWLTQNSDKLNVPVRITVGALFSFYGGKYRRAPKFFRIFYLEWFYRFCREPQRLFARYFILYPKVIFLIVMEKWFGK